LRCQLAYPATSHPSAQCPAIPCFPPEDLCGISQPFGWLFPTIGQIPKHYSPVRRSSACIATPVTARLACVRHAASVQSEPGSNSSLEDFENHRANEWIQNGPNLLLDILVTRS